MALLRIVNAFYAALFLVMALVSLAFLSSSLDFQFGVPANIWLSLAWTALFLLYAVIAFLNMRRAAAEGVSGRLIALNTAAAAPMLAGLLVGDPSSRFLCGVAALPFAVTVAVFAARRKGEAG